MGRLALRTCHEYLLFFVVWIPMLPAEVKQFDHTYLICIGPLALAGQTIGL